MEFLYTIKKCIVKERKIILAAFLLGLAFTVTTGFVTRAYSERVVNDIAKNVIRFHVRANSDSVKDQQLKLAVKNEILDKFQTELRNTDSVEESEDILFLRLNEIEECAKEKIAQLGYNYTVTAQIGNTYFPTKQYGDIVIPAGVYNALTIDIGEAEGSNWWCVMYPPLCYVDAAKQTLSDSTKEQFKNALSTDEYELIQLKNTENNASVKVKFKVVEWWQNKKEKDKPISVARKN